MNCSYLDITSRISDPPLWWDEEAVPRYCAFAPSEVAYIYADEAALVEIACQNCGQRFLVAMAGDRTGDHKLSDVLGSDDWWGWGDPPNMGCCPAGPTMGSEPVRVVEFWRRVKWEWARIPTLERALTAPWAKEATPPEHAEEPPDGQ